MKDVFKKLLKSKRAWLAVAAIGFGAATCSQTDVVGGIKELVGAAGEVSVPPVDAPAPTEKSE